MLLRKLIIEVSPPIMRLLAFLTGGLAVIAVYYLGSGNFERSYMLGIATAIFIFTGIITYGISHGMFTNEEIKTKCSEICDLFSDCDKEIT